MSTSQGYIFYSLQHFTTKLRNFTKHMMLFQAVVKFLPILNFFKILSNGGKVHRLPRFEPCRATPNQSNRRKPYGKGQSKKKSTGSAVIKDVILLSNPRMHLVPRGRTREDLYVRGFVSTFSITNEMRSSQVKNEFAALFASKRNGRPFKIVRAVGNKIVDANLTQGINGKILKHICGQGPVYLRYVRPTDTGHSWVEEDESEDDDEKGRFFNASNITCVYTMTYRTKSFAISKA